MKKLKDHVILYDAVCPMCNLYTKGFIKAGMLDENGRAPYQQMPDNLAVKVDRKRYVNEIALIDKTSGKVYYGVESLLRIVAYSFPILNCLFKNRVFLQIADKAYKFISFNRRVIVPAKEDQINKCDLNPSFHKGHRIAYLAFTWFITSLILSIYSNRLTDFLAAGGFYREFLVCGGQVAWQVAAMYVLRKKRIWNYLGNMMTISCAGALILLLVLVVGAVFRLQWSLFYACAFGAVVLLMFLEHIRRTKLLGLGWQLTVSWVLYRIVILLILLYPVYA